MAVTKKDDFQAAAAKAMLEAQKTTELLAKATREQAQKDNALKVADEQAHEKQKERAAAINRGVYDAPSATAEVTNSRTVDVNTAFKPLVVGEDKPVSHATGILEFSASVIKYSIEAHQEMRQSTEQLGAEVAESLTQDSAAAEVVEAHGGPANFVNAFNTALRANLDNARAYHETTQQERQALANEHDEFVENIADIINQPHQNISTVLAALNSSLVNKVQAVEAPAGNNVPEDQLKSAIAPAGATAAPKEIAQKAAIPTFIAQQKVVMLRRTAHDVGGNDLLLFKTLLNKLQSSVDLALQHQTDVGQSFVADGVLHGENRNILMPRPTLKAVARAEEEKLIEIMNALGASIDLSNVKIHRI